MRLIYQRLHKRYVTAFVMLAIVFTLGAFSSNTARADVGSEQLPGDQDLSAAKIGSLEELCAKGQLSCSMLGDGENTSSCALNLQNKTNEDMLVAIPPGQCLVPGEQNVQVMVSTSLTLQRVPAGQSVTASIPTLCCSPQNVPPPPAREISCRPSDHPNQDWVRIANATVRAVNELGQSGGFEKTLLNPESRAHTIAQLAVWKQIGDTTPDKDDDVTVTSVRGKFLKAAGLTEGKLSKEQKSDLSQHSQSVFATVDLTAKHSQVLLSNVDLTRKISSNSGTSSGTANTQRRNVNPPGPPRSPDASTSLQAENVLRGQRLGYYWTRLVGIANQNASVVGGSSSGNSLRLERPSISRFRWETNIPNARKGLVIVTNSEQEGFVRMNRIWSYFPNAYNALVAGPSESFDIDFSRFAPSQDTYTVRVIPLTGQDTQLFPESNKVSIQLLQGRN